MGPSENQNQSVELSVSGMTCASCVRHVEKALLKVPGVQKVSVNLATESAHIEEGPGVNPEQLIHAIEEAGYQATLKSSSLASQKKKG